jgi:hypothetical protein
MTFQAPIFRRFSALIGLVLFWGNPTIAEGCTACDSASGVELRAAIFGPNFAATLLLSSLPFILVLAIVAAIHFLPMRKD